MAHRAALLHKSARYKSACCKAIVQQSNTVTFDGGQAGYVDAAGKPLRKQLTLITNIEPLVKALQNKKCRPGNHKHGQIAGRVPGSSESRSKGSQVYPTLFVSVLVDAVVAVKYQRQCRESSNAGIWA